jgi:L-lactate dehydrogenase
MKVSIIGGGGLVGSCAAFALQCGGAAREIALVDANAELAAGQALDLQHGSPSVADQIFTSGDYRHAADSHVICITAGLRRKPDESRLALINRNMELFRSILEQMRGAKLREDVVVLVVSNPVDILTQVATEQLGLPPGRVIGLGTQLDTIRFCSLLAGELKAPPTQVKALILGEHGDSMVPVWSSATVGGLPLDKYPGANPATLEKIFQRARTSGAEMLKLKGGAGFAVGIAIRDVIESVLLDQRRLLPVSTVQNGAYGIRQVALSVPTVVSRQGASQIIEIDLWPKELQGLRASAAALRKTFDQVQSGATA